MRRLLAALALTAATTAAAPLAAGAADGGDPGTAVGAASKFASLCRYSHSGPDDPIVHPGHAGAAHLHDFFGNRTTGAGSTLDSLLAGRTTCLDQDDTAAYWVPALYVNGRRVVPTAVNTYYLAGRATRGDITAPPAGLKAVAGVSTGDTVFWTCEGTGRHVRSTTPPRCPNRTQLVLHLRFPACWNGTDLDSADHRSHLADPVRGRCPSSHPVAIPALQLNVRYPTRALGTVTLSSGGPETAHADFFNAWDQARLEHLTTTCLDTRIDCRQAATVS